ncbi:MAG TPA: VOC family protein [Rhodocyclaceae bacterium]|nr:VOC family protein [Rhodocyclaceae bacterium]
MKTNPVGWFEIYVEDLDRASKFYESVLGVKLEAFDNAEVKMRVFPRDEKAPGAGGALVYMQGFGSGGNSVLVYFMSENCATEEARAVKNGGRVQKSKMSIGEHGFISLLIDTEGNMFGVHSMK